MDENENENENMTFFFVEKDDLKYCISFPNVLILSAILVLQLTFPTNSNPSSLSFSLLYSSCRWNEEGMCRSTFLCLSPCDEKI